MRMGSEPAPGASPERQQLLGEDVRVMTERGERQFASGDRIMFLKNERGLGVKNGTLAAIEQVSAPHIAVRTDDGRRVAFDLTDYATIDHGSAAPELATAVV